VRISDPSSSRCVAKLWRHSSSHYASCVDGPDLVRAPSLLRTHGRDCPMVTTPNRRQSCGQALRGRPDGPALVDACPSRVLPGARCSRALWERRGPAEMPRAARSAPRLADVGAAPSFLGIAPHRRASCPSILCGVPRPSAPAPVPRHPSGPRGLSPNVARVTPSAPHGASVSSTASPARSQARSDKRRLAHRPRTAALEGRQATGHQVRAPHERHRRPEALADHARGVGLAPGVRSDEDVGRRGTGLHERPGWGPRRAAVWAGTVGAVVA
jgi:hypothetical protein